MNIIYSVSQGREVQLSFCLFIPCSLFPVPSDLKFCTSPVWELLYHHKNSVSGKPPSFKRWMETTRRVLTRSQKNVLLLINNLKSRLNGLLVGESSGNWHRQRGLLLYTYYGTVLAMWLFRAM